MDARKESKGEEDEQLTQEHSTVPASPSATEANLYSQRSSISSLDSQDSKLEVDADDRPSSDMEGLGDAYRRRRAQLMAGLENDSAKEKKYRRGRSRRQQANGSGTVDDKHATYSSDDGHDSDFSSLSTSDDVELSQFASGDALTDDEETGLTKKDKEHRKRRRRRITRPDGRVVGSVKTSSREHRDADRNVLKALVINVSLIMAWYLFSLSISIVSDTPRIRYAAVLTTVFSTTSGCLRRNTLIFTSHFSPPVYTCSSNSALRHSSFIFFRSYGRAWTVSPILKIITQYVEILYRMKSLS